MIGGIKRRKSRYRPRFKYEPRHPSYFARFVFPLSRTIDHRLKRLPSCVYKTWLLPLVEQPSGRSMNQATTHFPCL